MKFIISRASFYKDKKPCKEARRERLTYVDRRTVKTLAEAKLPENKHWSDQFFASGTNHRRERGMIARDVGLHKVWTVELNTLEELIKFGGKYGSLILGFETNSKEINRYIEIDDN